VIEMKRLFLSVAVSILCCGYMLGQAQEKVLWSFGSVPNDGIGPQAALISDNAGNLYGTTAGGGTAAGGTVFKLSPQTGGTWSETILYNFCTQTDCTDGYEPQAGLLMDSAGKLYGTAYAGGIVDCPHGTACGGTAFELSPPSELGQPWTYAVLYTFCSEISGVVCLDGSEPRSQLILDASGNLYGTTVKGGRGHDVDSYGGGVVFELSPGSNGWTETVLYSFCQLGRGGFCTDGANPEAGVTLSSGSLFGTTESGGLGANGLVYELSPGSNGWTEEVLYTSYNGSSYAPVTFSAAGNLFSTTLFHGFQLNIKHQNVRSISFTEATGTNSEGGVLVDVQRNALFGTAVADGANGVGTVWEVNPARQLVPLYNFCSLANCADGSTPRSSLIEDQSGNLYGTTQQGGAYGYGVVFEVTP
jgi:uncharacterized repeat protein (TIGR03803 family)